MQISQFENVIEQTSMVDNECQKVFFFLHEILNQVIWKLYLSKTFGREIDRELEYQIRIKIEQKSSEKKVVQTGIYIDFKSNLTLLNTKNHIWFDE